MCFFNGMNKEIGTKRGAAGDERHGKTPTLVHAPRNKRALWLHNGQWGASGSLCGQSYTLIDRDERAKVEDWRQRKEKDRMQWGNDHTLIRCVTGVSRRETAECSSFYTSYSALHIKINQLATLSCQSNRESNDRSRSAFGIVYEPL